MRPASPAGRPVSADGIELLDRATGFLLGVLPSVRSDMLTWPTPCERWDMNALLCHVAESLDVLVETGDAARPEWTSTQGTVPVTGPATESCPVARVRGRVHAVRGAWCAAGDPQPVEIGQYSLSPRVVALTGAVEIAVHGWDLGRACGTRVRLPPDLATWLHQGAIGLISDAERRRQFGTAIPLAATAGPGERLVAFLGRQPWWLSRAAGRRDGPDQSR